MQLLDCQRQQEKVAVIAAHRMSNSKKVLELTVAGFDAHWETMPLMHSSCDDGDGVINFQWCHNYVVSSSHSVMQVVMELFIIFQSPGIRMIRAKIM